MNTCFYCKKTFDEDDLRPYGRGGSFVCFDCATLTPERENETRANFRAQLDACGKVAVLDGSCAGPYPLDTIRKLS